MAFQISSVKAILAVFIFLNFLCANAQSGDDFLQWYTRVSDECDENERHFRKCLSYLLLDEQYFKPFYGKKYEELTSKERLNLKNKLYKIRRNKKYSRMANVINQTIGKGLKEDNQVTIKYLQIVKKEKADLSELLEQIQSDTITILELRELANKYKKGKYGSWPSFPNLNPSIQKEFRQTIDDQIERKEYQNFLNKIEDTKSFEYLGYRIFILEGLRKDIESGTFYKNLFSPEQREYFKDKIENELVSIKKSRPEDEKYFKEIQLNPNIVILPSGLHYEIIKKGESNIKPAQEDIVDFNYIGKFTNGVVFEDTYDIGVPYSQPIEELIPALQEALMLMSEGDIFRVHAPYYLAYGERRYVYVGAFTAVIFDLELIKIDKT